jgi:hypothetical protein
MKSSLSTFELGAVVLLNFAVCVAILFAVYAFGKIIDSYKRRKSKK